MWSRNAGDPVVTATEERLVTFNSGEQRLHGVLHLPQDDIRRALVFCHPFAEEKKCAHRTMVEAARGCAAAGCAVLRFDHRGCGDSAGSFGEFSLREWRMDIEAALDCAEAQTQSPVGLLGLRLGATLAAGVAESRPGVACLVLWEPIVNGARYIKQNLRRSMIKAMMTRHEGGEDSEGAASEAHALGEGTVDFDGYPVSEQMRQQMEDVDLLAGERDYTGPVLVLSLGARDEPHQALKDLANVYPRGTAIAVHQEPVWQRIGVIDADATVSTTVQWLSRLE